MSSQEALTAFSPTPLDRRSKASGPVSVNDEKPWFFTSQVGLDRSVQPPWTVSGQSPLDRQSRGFDRSSQGLLTEPVQPLGPPSAESGPENLTVFKPNLNQIRTKVKTSPLDRQSRPLDWIQSKILGPPVKASGSAAVFTAAGQCSNIWAGRRPSRFERPTLMRPPF